MKDYKFLNLPVIAYVFFLALFLRVYNLGAPSLWGDEGFSIWVGKLDIGTVIKFISTDMHPPLYFILLHYWIKLFGASEFAARSLSVIFSIGTFFSIYYLCLEVFENKKIGILASFLFAVSSFAIIDNDANVKMYSMLMFLTTLSVYLLVKIINAGKSRVPANAGIHLWILYIITLILLLYTQYMAFFVIIAQLLCMVLFYKNNAGAKGPSPLLIILILLVSFLPWSKAFLEQIFIFHKQGPEINLFLIQNIYENIVFTFYTFFIALPFKKPILIYYITAGMSFVLILTGVNYALKNKKASVLPVIFSTVLISALICSCILPKRNFIMPKYLSLMFPIYIVLISCAIMNFKSKYIKYLLLVIFALLNIALYYKYAHDPAYWKQNWNGIAQYVTEKEKQGGVILLQPSWNTHLFNYYYKQNLYRVKPVKYYEEKKGWGYDFYYLPGYFEQGGLPQIAAEVMSKEFLSACEKYDRIIYILGPYDAVINDPKSAIFNWINQNYKLKQGVFSESFYCDQLTIVAQIYEKK